MIGDEIFVNEDTYLHKIGTLVTTVDLLVKRIAAKDNALKEKDAEIESLKASESVAVK